jgi:hypothetical protein
MSGNIVKPHQGSGCRGKMVVTLFLLVGIGWIFFTEISRNRELRRKLVAKRMCNQLTVAINAYHQEYGEWPPFLARPKAGQAKDFCVGDRTMGAPFRTNEILFPLLGLSKGSNAENAANPQKIVFFESRSATFSRDGKPRDGLVGRGPNGQLPPPEFECCIYDPWGPEYGIVIDSNGDGRLDLTGIYNNLTGEASPRKEVGVFSMGKDGTLGTNGDRMYRKGVVPPDDIASWE